MKKLFFLLSVVFTLNAFGQYERQNVVKIELLRTIVGQYNIGYEYAFTDHSAINAMMLFGGKTENGIEYFFYGGQFDYRYYFLKNKQAPKGLFLAPGIGFINLEAEEIGINNSATATLLALQGTFGYQYIFKFGLSFDIYAGYGVYVGAAESKNTNENAGTSGGYPTLGLTIGYAF